MSEKVDWRIKKVRKIKGKIKVCTGLHIGGSTETMEIGGVDNPILKNPANNEPYIPGSSLKGKMRSLTEWNLGMLRADGKPYTSDDPDCPVTRVFGTMAGSVEIGPTRLVVRDAFLSEESRDSFKEGRELTEIKHENSINRITAMANPRPLERVVPGISFDLDMVYKIIDTGDGGDVDQKNFEEVVLKALALVQEDCLGGCGSRGCGKVEFVDLQDEQGRKLEIPALTEAAG